MKKKFKWQRHTLSAAILGALSSANGATINVDGSCTLVDAIEAANTDAIVGACSAGSGDDVIQVVTPDTGISINTIFEASVNGPGSAGLPIINSTITLEGNGLTVSANNNSENFRLFEVDESGDLTLNDVTVTGADDGYGFGSGLLSYGGRVTINNSTFEKNNGGVLVANSFGNEINNSVIRHNISSSYNYSAGLQTIYAEVSINNTSLIKNNRSPSGYIRGGGGSLVPAGGAGLFQSEVTMTNSTVSGNISQYAAGISISSASPPAIRFNLPHFANSQMRGSIQNDVSIINSTITNNTSYIAAGILELSQYGTLTLQGNVIAGNNETALYDFAPNIYSDGSITINVDANNIIGDNGNPGAINITLGPSDSSFLNATSDNLYPLALTNGQLVHPLKVNSAAVDGNVLDCHGSIFDQEGKGRGIDGDNNGTFLCDVGSFEHSLPILADGAPCDFTNAILTANNDSSVGGCQPGNGHDIIVLPQNSTQSSSEIAYVNYAYPGGFAFGFPSIDSAITIEANGSSIVRDAGSVDDFDLLHVSPQNQLILIDSTVSGANGNFGAVSTWYGGNVKIIDSRIINNQSTGVMDFVSINSAVINSIVSGNTYNPGAVSENYANGVSTLVSTGFELSNTVISQNSGYAVGALDTIQSTQFEISNTTLSNNTSIQVGGIRLISNNATLTGLTITNNAGFQAGGMFVQDFGYTDTLSMNHSIVSGNVLTSPPPPVTVTRRQAGLLSPAFINSAFRGGTFAAEITLNYGTFTLDAFNVIGQNNDAGTNQPLTGATDVIPTGSTATVIDLALADNGGTTLTHLPVVGGPAVDLGESNCLLSEDQRGFIRPWDGDGDNAENCDAGAVELGSVAASDIIFKDGFDPVIVMMRRINH